MGISRRCAHKWVSRFDAEGAAGLQDRSSRPRTSPSRTPARVEQRVLKARREHRCDAVGLAHHTGVPASTCGRILRRYGVPRLADCDPITGEVIRGRRMSARRYEHPHPGDLVHVDIKKLGRIPDGGGWRVHGRAVGGRNSRATTTQRRGNHPVIGYGYVHSAVDDHSRLAYSEILANEQGPTAAGFWLRAQAFFAAHGITVHRVLTDNGSCYRSRIWLSTLATAGITHKRTRPYRPQTNGKVERFNRTLLTEWAYARPYSSESARRRAFTGWLHIYNHHRPHTALGGRPPAARVTNLSGQDI
jgi:transposase InsO family protein